MAKSADYWKNRFSAVENTEHEAGLSAYQEIEAQYQQAQKAVSDKLAIWYERLARNNNISLQEAKKLLSRDELREFKWDVNDYIRYGRKNAVSQQWMKELENASAKAHISRLEAIKLQMQQQVEVLFGNQLDTTDHAMRDVYEDSYYRTAYEIQKGTGVGTTFAKLDTRKIDKVINRPWAQDGSDFSSRIWNNKAALVQQLNTTLTQNVIRGEDPQRAIDAIAKRMDVSKTAAGRLVMTEEAAFSSAAQKDCFKELGVSEYEVVVTLDDATCNECASMDGMVFKMSDYAPGSTAPPFHCYCRCMTIPHIDDDFGDAGERAARDANGKTYYVPADMTYKEWKQKHVDSNGDSMFLQTGGKDKIVDTGGKHYKPSDPDNPRDFKAAEEYRKISRTNDIHEISETAGFSEDDIKTIKRHVFFEKHKLYDGYGLLAPDYDMAVAWNRLREGHPEDRDILLLKHELLESQLEKKYNLTLEEAHKRATEVYDWVTKLAEDVGEKGEPDGLLHSD